MSRQQQPVDDQSVCSFKPGKKASVLQTEGAQNETLQTQDPPDDPKGETLSATSIYSLVLLVVAYAIGLAVVGMTLSSTAIAAKRLLEEEGWSSALATLPTGLQMIGSMCSTYPVSILMERHGRTSGFIAAAAFGVLGGGVCAMGMVLQKMALLTVGSMLVGVAATGTQLIRFAALDVVHEDYSARAASFVIAGGLAGAVGGPFAATASRNELGSHEFTGTYALLAAFTATQGAVLLMVKYPLKKRAVNEDQEEKLVPLAGCAVFSEGRGQAMLLSAICYAVMVTVMTPTPLVMEDEGYSFTESSTVIQVHLAAMFAPSFFTGDVIKLSSSRSISYIGTLVMLSSFVMCLIGRHMYNFVVGLLLLGLGWNAGFIGATVLLAQCSPLHQAKRLQGINDTMLFALSATGVLLSAVVVESQVGWAGLLWIAIGCTGSALLVVVLLKAFDAGVGNSSDANSEPSIGVATEAESPSIELDMCDEKNPL